MVGEMNKNVNVKKNFYALQDHGGKKNNLMLKNLNLLVKK